MAKKGGSAKKKSTLGFWPLLSKPAVAIGKQASVVGKFWQGCAAAHKDKRYLCTVVEFRAMHDFGGGRASTRPPFGSSRTMRAL
jgi:hypothetical protein